MAFKYLRYTFDYRLYYISYLMILKKYNDANWISDTKDLRSTSGYIFIFFGE